MGRCGKPLSSGVPVRLMPGRFGQLSSIRALRKLCAAPCSQGPHIPAHCTHVHKGWTSSALQCSLEGITRGLKRKVQATNFVVYTLP